LAPSPRGPTGVGPWPGRRAKGRAEGHLPRIALSTGGLDALECLLLKIGIAKSEFTTPDEDGRVNLFAGRGGTDQYADSVDFGAIFPLPDLSLWNDEATLSSYDVVLLSCEGGEYLLNKPPDARQRMADYANRGGRVFFSHYHKLWLEQGPAPFPDVMSFNDTLDDLRLDASVDTSFPKGQALASWLVNVGGSTTPGIVSLVDAQNTGRTENPLYAQRWVYDPFDSATDDDAEPAREGAHLHAVRSLRVRDSGPRRAYEAASGALGASSRERGLEGEDRQ